MQVKFLPTIQPNTCGECTLCCKIMSVKEFDKPVNTWCKHATKKKGCGIYETRPHMCRIFQCGWLHQNMPAEFRPDRIHGLITADITSIQIHEDVGYPGHASRVLQPIIQNYINTYPKNYVCVVTGAQRRLIAQPEIIERLFIKKTDDPDEQHVYLEQEKKHGTTDDGFMRPVQELGKGTE
jgi:hypothetical protein